MVKPDNLVKKGVKNKGVKKKIVRKTSKKNNSREKESKIKLIEIIRNPSGLEKDIKKVDKEIEMENFSDFIFSVSPNHISSNLEQIAPLGNIRTAFVRDLDKKENSEMNYETGGRGDYTENQEYVSSEERKYAEFDSQINVGRINRNVASDHVFRNPETTNRNRDYKTPKEREYQTKPKDTRVSHRQKLPWEKD